jgi:ATP-dependent DNA helicase RecQ
VLEDGTAHAKNALGAIKQTGQRFGAVHVINVLLGNHTEKIRGLGHSRLPAYGQGGGESKDTWRSILRQLVAAGYLRLDIAGYGGLKLTPKGRALLEDGGEFRFRRDATRPKSKNTRTTGKAAPARSDLAESDSDLFTALKELRLDLALQRGVPAYVIFSDRTLVDMAGRKPADDIAFAEVFGVGEAKLNDFAEPFMAVISGFS